jgi:acyl-CoA synthetase (AMP-forming)/AMP-acid ligase II
VGVGDRVALALENCPEYVEAYYGALAAGAVAVAVNPAARMRDLTCWVAHSGASVLVAPSGHPDIESLAALEGVTVVTVGKPIAGTVSWDDALAGHAGDVRQVPAETAAAIIYTSGTTGRPKGVTLSHENLSANVTSIIQYLKLTSSDRALNLLPFFYSYGSSVLHTHLAVGGSLILENRLLYPQKILARIGEERATGLPGVPSTFSLLLQAGDFSRFDLGSLRYVTQAGGAMTPSQTSRLREALPDVAVFIMYGQTEATARLTFLPPDRLTEKLGSAGIPIPGVELRIETDTGHAAAPGELGEVCVRGRNVMLGYYRDPEATSKVLRDGWLHTGDLGYVDADGFLFLQGRRSDMIKSGAHRISPLDVEEVIAALPDVAEVAVVGIPDEVLGEAIKAVITLRPGASLEPSRVQQHCADHLPRFKVPKIVEFATRLPRTTSGKIMRYQLATPGLAETAQRHPQPGVI